MRFRVWIWGIRLEKDHQQRFGKDCEADMLCNKYMLMGNTWWNRNKEYYTCEPKGMIRHGDICNMYKGRVPSTQGSVDERYSQVSLSEGLNLKVSSTPSLRRLSKRCCSSDHIDCELFSLITTLLSSHNNPAAIFSTLPLRTTNVHPRAECFPYLVQLPTFGNTFTEQKRTDSFTKNTDTHI